MSSGSSAFLFSALRRKSFDTMDNTELAAALVSLGCPAEKSAEMAAQLDRRARQLSEQKGHSYEDALGHLLQLMQQGWAAKERN
jgi:hypothetical protein